MTNRFQYFSATRLLDILQNLPTADGWKERDFITHFIAPFAHHDGALGFQDDGAIIPGPGDEDYVIVKLFSLRWLGWDTQSMRLMVVQDTNLRLPHAILAVASGKDIFVLDNPCSN